jgi:hypothetical protein
MGFPASFSGMQKRIRVPKSFSTAGGIIFLVPIVNPDGYDGVRRENENGKDLNRDFDVRRYVTKLAQTQRGDFGLSLEDLSELAAYVNGPKLTEPESRALLEAMKGVLSKDSAKTHASASTPRSSMHCSASPSSGEAKYALQTISHRGCESARLRS